MKSLQKQTNIIFKFFSSYLFFREPPPQPRPQPQHLRRNLLLIGQPFWKLKSKNIAMFLEKIFLKKYKYF
jgi:hypothetical protein